jgi:hydrogenase/urease accessory protein HupE
VRFLVAILLVLPTAVRAHPLAPSLLELHESGDGRAEIGWKVPLLRAPGPPPEPVLPLRCHPTSPRVESVEDTGLRTRWTVDCGAGTLTGEQIGVTGLDAVTIAAVIRVVLADGRVVQGVVTAGRPLLTIPPRPRALDVLYDYGRLGIEHILGGPDHLLFVFGLVLLAGSPRRLLGTVTAFTAGHSVTLTAAALGVITVPVAPIEVAIAASVFVLAVELARDPSVPSAIRRRPWVMAALFGLLHGLGFAAALRDAGLPSGEVPLALLAFNSGIELGQLAFVAGVLAFRAVAGPLAAKLPGWTLRLPLYGMGSLAAFWWIERTAAWLR